MDDLERSLKTGHQSGELRQGVELILKKLLKLLEDEGVRPIESVGKPFDVAYHDALLQVENEAVAPGMVMEEHEKGYCLNDRVLRHAKVIVSK